MEAVREILQFLEPSARLDLKVVALQHVLGLTGSPEGLELLSGVPEMNTLLLNLTEDRSNSVAKDASLALINISANAGCAKKWLSVADSETFAKLWRRIEFEDPSPETDPAKVDRSKPDPSVVVDPCCMIISNLTIDPENCEVVWKNFVRSKITVSKIVEVLCIRRPEGPRRHYLATTLSNLSQLTAVRQGLLNRESPLIANLFVFTEHPDIRRRGGVIGTIRNCCFDTIYHEWLLQTVDILPRLLLPLAGPTPDTLDEGDIDKLPIDLQYLDEDKKIEEDPDIRKLLLESLLQLCATKKGREYLRSKNSYFILRELYNAESDKNVKLACENVIDILIKKEDEINVDNYHEHDVPEDVIPKLIEMDEDYLKD